MKNKNKGPREGKLSLVKEIKKSFTEGLTFEIVFESCISFQYWLILTLVWSFVPFILLKLYLDFHHSIQTPCIVISNILLLLNDFSPNS